MKRIALLLAALLAYVGLALAAVNVNTATKEQLEALSGIGPVKAQAIIDYRTKNGNFKSVDDLKKVPGIGDATLEKIRKDVTLSGATSMPAKAAETKAAPAKKADKKADEKKAPEKKADEKKAPEKKADEKKAPEKKADEKKAPEKKADEKKAPEKKADAKKDEKKKEDEKKK